MIGVACVSTLVVSFSADRLVPSQVFGYLFWGSAIATLGYAGFIVWFLNRGGILLDYERKEPVTETAPPMKMKVPRPEPRGKDRKLVVAGVGIILMTALFATSFLPPLPIQAINGQQVVTFTVTSNGYITISTTTTNVQTTTVVLTSFVTVTKALPASYTITGKASANGIGQTALSIEFQRANGTSISAAISNGQYSTSLPNGPTYIVVIHYSAIPIGGSCKAGAIVVEFSGNLIQADFSC